MYFPERWVEWAVCIAICLLGTGLIRSDAFHSRTKIPETDQIAAIYMYADYEHLYRDEADFETLKKFNRNLLEHKQEYLSYSYQQNHSKYNLPKTQSTESATAISSDVTGSNASVSYSNDDYISSIQITYYLKNGRK